MPAIEAAAGQQQPCSFTHSKDVPKGPSAASHHPSFLTVVEFLPLEDNQKIRPIQKLLMSTR
jgi:hypothetical protein